LRQEKLRATAWPFVAAGCLIAGILTGCATRESTPVVAPDSTLVYPSKLRQDIQASISLELKDSWKQEEQLMLERRRVRQLTRQKEDLEKKIREGERLQRASESRQNKVSKNLRKSSGKKSSAKSGKNSSATSASGKKKSAKSGKASKELASAAGASSSNKSKASRTASKSGSPRAPKIDPAWRTELQAVNDSLRWYEDLQRRRDEGLLPEERTFELQDGARVQATFTLTNLAARGHHTIPLHVLWIKPDGKAAFRKYLEIDPDSTDSFTSSFTITPVKRVAGRYVVRLYAFREPVAEKRFYLYGEGFGSEEEEEPEEQM